MKVQATCNTCGRRFLLSQIGADSEAPGRCPFCGAHFAKHYSSVLVDAVRDAEKAAAYFATSITRLDSMETGFDIDFEDLIEEVSSQVGRGSSDNVA
jgi:hypothetical protein